MGNLEVWTPGTRLFPTESPGHGGERSPFRNGILGSFFATWVFFGIPKDIISVGYGTGYPVAVLQFRDVYPGSWFLSIPDLGSPIPGSRIPDLGSRIRDPGYKNQKQEQIVGGGNFLSWPFL